MIFQRILSFLRYFFSATNAHGIHSPFIYDLYTTVIRERKQFYAFDKLREYRKALAQDNRILSLQDLGAGAANQPSPSQVKVAAIYKRSCHSEKDTEFLFRLVHRSQPTYVLELGTCLGVSTLYLAKAQQDAKVYTFEGNPDYATLAKRSFETYHAANITLIEGNIHHTLQATLDRLPRIDFAFLDAHHEYAPTLQFFKQCSAKSHEGTVIVLDDIHWSPAMEKAWEAIKQLPEVRQTVDLYQFGLVFFKPGQVKEHFVLRY